MALTGVDGLDLYQVTTRFGACAGVEVDAQGIIRRTAPIYSKFRGQPLANLRNWKQVTQVTGPIDWRRHAS